MNKNKFLGILSSLILAIMVMSMTAYASTNEYTNLIPSDSDDVGALANKVVKFNNYEWYIIADNSSSVDTGTVTLFAKNPIGASIFDNNSNVYSTSAVKNFLDDFTKSGGSFANVEDTIETTVIKTNKYNSSEQLESISDVKLYLLSTEEANALPLNVRKSDYIGTTVNAWWLRSPGQLDSHAAFVYGDTGNVIGGGNNWNAYAFGVRPALKLRLSSVLFSSTTKEFTQKPAVAVMSVSLNKATATLIVGGTEKLTATVSPTNATHPDLDWDSSDVSVATVDGSGIVTAVAEGTATITVKSTDGSDKSATCVVTVNKDDNKDIDSVNINKVEPIYVGETALVSISVRPDNAVYSTKWSVEEISTRAEGSHIGKLYSDEKCTREITGEESDITKVYVKGISVGYVYVKCRITGTNITYPVATSVSVLRREEKQTEKQESAPSGGGGSLPQTADPTPAPTTPSETVEQPTTTGDPTITQDAFTGVSETIAPSTDGTAVVTSVAGTTGKTLRITGTVNQGGTNYPVSSFATNSFSRVESKNIIIDLKTSGNTQTVTFQPRTFKGSKAKKLTLRLSSSSQVKFSSGALSGAKIKKIVVSGLNKKEFKKVQKKLKKAGYKGKIVKK